MRATLAIAKRDFLSLVTSPMFLVMAALCCGIWSYLYLTNLFRFAAMMGNPMMAQQGGGNIQFTVFVQHLSIVHLFMLFLAPAVTMRLLAEEKKQRTFDLLLTTPITSTSIAVGKFLGGWASILVLVLLALAYPVATAAVAEFSWATLATSFLGLIMISGFYIAVGLFASSLTSSVLFSFILAVILSFGIWFLGASSQSVETTWLSAFLSHVSIGEQLFNFMRGILKVSTLTFFVTAIGVFVFLSQRVVESARWR